MRVALEIVEFRIPPGRSVWETLLTPEERARAAAFRFARDRDRFAAIRGWLRAELGERLGCRPQDLRFHYGPEGKPRVGGLEFNLTHEGDHALLALSPAAPVGVDLARAPADPDELAPIACTPAELAWYANQAVRPRAFSQLWSVKEAVVKAWGQGLSVPPDAVETGGARSGRIRHSGTWWTWHSWRHASGAWASVAVRGPDFPLPFVERPAMVCAGSRNSRVA